MDPFILPTIDPPIVPLLRRSTRVPTSLRWCSNYVLHFSGMDYSAFSGNYGSFLATISRILEPLTFVDTIENKEWVYAMKDEIKTLAENKTWVVIDLPEDARAIGSKWVYKVKYHSDCTLELYKARLVEKGYPQRVNTNFTETFSLVVKIVTVR